MRNQDKRRERITVIKGYLRVDFPDDDGLIELLYDAAVQILSELLPSYNARSPTPRQTLLEMAVIRDLYENREMYARSRERMRAGISSLLLQEQYGGG